MWYAELLGGPHGFDAFVSWRFDAVIDGVEAFLAQALAHQQRPPGGSVTGADR